MANEAKGKDQEAPRAEGSAELSVAECVKAIAAYNARADLTSEKQMLLFLKSWWSNTYNRPLKDPLLESYTLEELLYEFYDKIERRKAAEEMAEAEADKMEEAKEKEVLDWAEAEEQKELEEMKRQAAKKPSADPTKDPDNIKWMEKQLQAAKQEFGENFGEDIEEDFGDD